MRQTSCLVFNPIMVERYAALFSYTAVVHGLILNDGFDVKLNLDDCNWLDQPWFNQWFSLALARSVGHA